MTKLIAMNRALRSVPSKGAWLAIATPLAFAQPVVADDMPEANSAAQVELGEVNVIGARASLESAQQIKRRKIEIVDSVVASDINKLPDFNVTDALSRITGIQILRDRGEGAGVAIRGLSQMETLLNGREIFTAGNGLSAGFGRNLDFADIPSEMLAGIDVYKTSSANQIEGGVGGTIDLRTHRPFDFSGSKAVGSVRLINGDLARNSQAQFSTLLSDRWQTNGVGEFGALANLVYQKRGWREDQKSAGAFVARTNIIPGQTVFVPGSVQDISNFGQRERTSANMVFEWLPLENLELYAEGSLTEFLTSQDTNQMIANFPATPVTTGAVLFPGTSDMQRITWLNAPVTTVGAARDTRDRNSQLAVGGNWTDAALTLKTDLSYTKSHSNLYYSAITLGGTAAAVTANPAGNVSLPSVGGTNLNSLAGFNSAGIWYASRPFDGELKAARLDGEYQFSNGFLDTISTGVRLANRHATDSPGQVSIFPVAPNVANAASLIVPSSYGNFVVGDPAQARNINGLCNTLGIACAIPASNPLGTWDISENTQSGHVMAKFGTMGRQLDGNAGLRVVRTQESVSGNQSVSTGVAPIQLADSYTDILPSMNLRYRLASGLYLRGAASKTMTRQNFDQLSPSLTLNPILLIGSAGNPALKPVRADNLDLAVEKYFSKSTSVHVTGFWKKVDGFVTTVVGNEVYNGAVYAVSRPQNSSTANIKGLELGYQQFYDFLPGWLNGLGLQANYTYLESSGTTNSLTGLSQPLTNLSRNSYNLIGMYEKHDISARIAYNWRDRFWNTVGVNPVYTAAYGWMDAQLGYRIDKTLTVAIEASNLLGTVRRAYYGTESRPQGIWINDRQIAVTMTADL